jgi:hypothetical protein
VPNSDLDGFRRAVQLRDRCRAAAVAASHRLEVPMSPVQANVAFDAMVDLIREHPERRARNDARLMNAFESLIKDADGNDLDPAEALVVGKIRRVLHEAIGDTRPNPPVVDRG